MSVQVNRPICRLWFHRQLVRALGGAGALTRGQRRAVRQALEDAAFAGGCRERVHACEAAKTCASLGLSARDVYDAITQVPTMDVVGGRRPAVCDGEGAIR